MRSAGLDWPLHGLTMVGLNRLDDLQACVESVVRDGVEGDLIEAGTWRGGASILMRATLDSLGATERTVHVADSFQGFPPPTSSSDLNAIDFLAVPARGGARQLRALRPRPRRAHRARASSRRRCPRSPATAGRSCASTPTPTRRRARRSTRCTRGLAVGGYLIVDDYGVMAQQECRRAVDEFRARARHRRTARAGRLDLRALAARGRRADRAARAAPRPAPARAEAVPRAAPPHVPTGRELELEHEVAALRERLQRAVVARRLAAAMIAFGSSITRPDVYRACAEPGIRRAAEPDAVVYDVPAIGSISRSYNALLDRAAALEDLEALVLVHQDAEIMSADLCATIRATLGRPRRRR